MPIFMIGRGYVQKCGNFYFSLFHFQYFSLQINFYSTFTVQSYVRNKVTSEATGEQFNLPSHSLSDMRIRVLENYTIMIHSSEKFENPCALTSSTPKSKDSMNFMINIKKIFILVSKTPFNYEQCIFVFT